jgi:hypothetical protein
MEPYLSVVIAARETTTNDLRRIQLFLEAWIRQAKRHSLVSEVIVAGPQTTVTLPGEKGPCEIRFVETPAGATAAKVRNAGIREARGKFILATNPDVLFSDELVQFLASDQLDETRMFRADRYDVDAEVTGVSTHLHAREGTFALTPDGLRRNMPDDITPPDSGLNFGPGWFPPEKYAASGETFRWMCNDAEILTAVPEGGGILLLEMEPGPGLGSIPQTLQVIDENRSPVSEWPLPGRTTVALAVPAGEGARQSFRLRVSGGGRPVLDDDRILNLAVFRCDWVEPNQPLREPVSLRSAIEEHKSTLGRLLGARRKADGPLPAIVRGPFTAVRAARLLGRRGTDIFEAGLDYQLGPGWYYLEESEGERFRWLSPEASFLLRLPRETSRLGMLIEPGPNQGDAPLWFVARSENENGALLTRQQVTGLTYLEFTVPAAPGSIAALHFKSEGAIQPAGADTRPLSFRAFACGAGRRDISAPALWNRWPVLPLGSKAPTKDWFAALEPVTPQLGEMGHPDHLHTNAASDFLLMSRERWLDVRGFPEIAMTPERIDALLCYAAHHCGVREEVLAGPMRVFHFGAAAQHTDSEQYGMPLAVQQEDLMWLIAQMRSLHTPVIFNREDWVRQGNPPT